MNELLKIKNILEVQISVTKEMIEDVKSILPEDSTYRKDHIKKLEARIEAWEQTLKCVEKEIEYAERDLEELNIFKSNNYETYLS